MGHNGAMRLSRTAYRATCAVAVLLILLLAASRIWLVPAAFSTDPNEGWNAFQALRAIGVGGPLYPPPGSLTGNNYPPLSFLLIGNLSRLFGDPIVIGRIMAGAAVLAIAIEVRAAVLRLTGDARAATLGAIVFLGFVTTLFRTYLLLGDPQWLAHAVMTAGFVLLIPRAANAEPTAGAVILAALLMAIGGLIKHNLIALPIAATVWLAAYHRRASGLWIITGVAALAIAALATFAFYGPDAFADLLTPRRQSWARMIVKSLPTVAAFLPGLVLAARLWGRRAADPRLDLILLALPIALLLGIFQRSGLGVDRNAHFETVIALAIAAGTTLGRDDRVPSRLLAGLAFVVLVPIGLLASLREIRERPDIGRDWDAMVQRIRAIPGPVACEEPGLCLRAGKSFEIDFFLYGEAMAAGRGDTLLAQSLAAHRFAAIEREEAAPPSKHEPPNPIWAPIDAAFAPGFTGEDGRSLLVPR
jgi:hypothetical protein